MGDNYVRIEFRVEAATNHSDPAEIIREALEALEGFADVAVAVEIIHERPEQGS